MYLQRTDTEYITMLTEYFSSQEHTPTRTVQYKHCWHTLCKRRANACVVMRKSMEETALKARYGKTSRCSDIYSPVKQQL